MKGWMMTQRKRHKLRPIRTKEQCLAAGDSFVRFSPACLPHMPLLRRVRVAWMVLWGKDPTQWDIDCGHHRLAEVDEQIKRMPSQVRRRIAEVFRAASEAFGGDDET